jgi:hypothetical protein
MDFMKMAVPGFADKPMWKRISHKMFHCPTFWNLKPAFRCPICRATYRCYWDGNDVEGVGINLCGPCAEKHGLGGKND